MTRLTFAFIKDVNALGALTNALVSAVDALTSLSFVMGSDFRARAKLIFAFVKDVSALGSLTNALVSDVDALTSLSFVMGSDFRAMTRLSAPRRYAMSTTTTFDA